MKLLNLIALVIILMALTTSCNPKFPSGKLSNYYMYLDGDSGRTVTITYLQKEEKEYPKENITVSEEVSLPFFKESHIVQFIGDAVPECYLQINSDNDSTTKAVIFDDELPLADGKCGVIEVFLTENAVGDCAYCKDISKDSIMTYLKNTNYPCYLEFSEGEESKRVDLYD